MSASNVEAAGGLSGPMEQKIRKKLETELLPLHLELVNESHMHSVPKGSETHFRLMVVSERFAGLTRVARGRLVHEILAEELKTGVHALSHRTLTPEEWQAAGGQVAMQSPECLGGSKHDNHKKI